MIDTLATIGGFAAFLAIVIGLVFIPYCLSGEDGRENYAAAVGWLIVGLIGGLIGLDYGQAVPLIAYVIAVPAYFVIGFLWFIWKWRALILAKRAIALAAFERETREYQPGQPGVAPSATFENFSKHYRPVAAQHAERITGWILLWPWGVVWTVLKWPWHLAKEITLWASGIADRMVERLWRR